MPEPAYQEIATRIRRKLRHTSRFYSVDVHCHTPLSPCFGRRDGESALDLAASVQDIAAAACGAGHFVLAVTDHHRCENATGVREAADRIKQAGENRYPNNNLVVLPGMEIAVEENGRTVHALAIFPEAHNPAQIERILDDSGIEPNPELRREPCLVTRKRLVEIVSRIRQCGGLAILAHINSTNGYRQEMREARRTPEQILAGIVDLGVDAVEVSSPTDVPHFRHEGKQIACVIGSDAHYVREIGAAPYSTHAKMTDPGFDDLKRALEDPETRLRLAEPARRGIRRITGVEFSGGFLDGQTIAFTPDLNCLIGGRGTGKSTLIEAIRYVLQCPIPEARQDRLEEMRAEVFEGCTITLLFEDSRGEGYVLRRMYGEPETHVTDLNGTAREDVDLSVTQNLKVNVYGWSEIEGTANSPAQQLDLIDTFVPTVPELKAEEGRSLGSLRSNARSILSQNEAIAREQTQIGNLVELREELRRLGESETDEERRKAKADFEGGLLETAAEQVAAAITSQQGESAVECAEAVLKQINHALQQGSVLSVDQMQGLKTVLGSFVQQNSVLRAARANTLKELRRLAGVIQAKKTQVAPNHQAAWAAYERLLDRLAQPRDREIARRREYLRGEILRREQAALRKAQAEERLTQLRTTRQGLIAGLRDVRARLYRARSAHVDEIVNALPRRATGIRIGIHIIEQGNRDSLVALLEAKLVGLPRHWHEQGYPQTLASHFGPAELAALLRNDDARQLETAGFAPEEAEDVVRHFRGREVDLLEFEACACSDLAVIELEVEGTPRPIEKLSPGQRCTALLPIILVETDSPLIMDQPEDNLDNQFVFDLVVDTLRRLKERRQVIVATHNPNIPVSGDAENIVVFRPDGRRGAAELNGSIDYPPVITAVETLMEGGREAFELRMVKYGLAPRR